MLLLHTKKSFMDGLATIFDHNCAYCNQKKIHCRVSQKITFLSIVITISIFLIGLSLSLHICRVTCVQASW